MEMERIGRVLQAMQDRGLAQMIVCDPQSIDYLTGVYVEPMERLFALYLRADGHHIFFLNKLFTVPETPIEQVWFTDTDDAVGLIAQRVQAGEALGIDKEWTARFLLPLMERLPGTPCVLASDCVDSVRARKDEKEQELMRLLINNSSHFLPKETIFLKIWGYDGSVNANCVEAYISFLRKKLSLLQSSVRITVVRNIGYSLEESGHDS